MGDPTRVLVEHHLRKPAPSIDDETCTWSATIASEIDFGRLMPNANGVDRIVGTRDGGHHRTAYAQHQHLSASSDPTSTRDDLIRSYAQSWVPYGGKSEPTTSTNAPPPRPLAAAKRGHGQYVHGFGELSSDSDESNDPATEADRRAREVQREVRELLLRRDQPPCPSGPPKCCPPVAGLSYPCPPPYCSPPPRYNHVPQTAPAAPPHQSFPTRTGGSWLGQPHQPQLDPPPPPQPPPLATPPSPSPPPCPDPLPRREPETGGEGGGRMQRAPALDPSQFQSTSPRANSDTQPLDRPTHRTLVEASTSPVARVQTPQRPSTMDRAISPFPEKTPSPPASPPPVFRSACNSPIVPTNPPQRGLFSPPRRASVGSTGTGGERRGGEVANHHGPPPGAPGQRPVGDDFIGGHWANEPPHPPQQLPLRPGWEEHRAGEQIAHSSTAFEHRLPVHPRRLDLNNELPEFPDFRSNTEPQAWSYGSTDDPRTEDRPYEPPSEELGCYCGGSTRRRTGRKSRSLSRTKRPPRPAWDPSPITPVSGSRTRCGEKNPKQRLKTKAPRCRCELAQRRIREQEGREELEAVRAEKRRIQRQRDQFAQRLGECECRLSHETHHRRVRPMKKIKSEVAKLQRADRAAEQAGRARRRQVDKVDELVRWADGL